MNNILTSPPIIILVRPQLGENIGAAARVMHNFNVSDLRIVTPRDGWPNPAATTMAAGGKTIIEQATLYNSCNDAVADCQTVLATSARNRELTIPHITADQISYHFNTHTHKTAILFGCEQSGLSNEELSMANALIHLPTNPEYSSLNLAQAVGIICYEWNKQQHSAHSTSPHMPAPKEEIQHFLDYIKTHLEQNNFFRTSEKQRHTLHNLEVMLNRPQWSSQELCLLWGIMKSFEKT